MDEGLLSAHLVYQIEWDRTQGIHGDETADPGGTNMRDINSLSLRCNADQLRPGVFPFHPLEIDFDACFTFECRHQSNDHLIVRLGIRDEGEFNCRHVCLAETFLTRDIVSAMV